MTKASPYPDRHLPRVAAAALLLGAASLAACKTDPSGAGDDRPIRTTPTPVEQMPPQPLPEGPVATPAQSVPVTHAHVTVALLPMGEVPTDGLVLPLLSPDGSMLATQTGSGPSWATITAGRAQQVAAGTFIELWSTAGDTPVRAQAQPREAGLLLGRGATNDGVLVEQVRADGSRAVGLLEWQSGAVRWLVEDGEVNAHAVVSDSGALAYVTRAVDAPESTLVVRSARGAVSTLGIPGSSFLYPFFAPGDAFLYCFMASPAGLELRAYGLEADGPPLGALSARAPLTDRADALTAYQCVASAQSPSLAPAAPGAPSQAAPDRLLFVHPARGRVCVFEPRTGEVLSAAPRSVAGAWWRGAPADETGAPIPWGLFVTTERGLEFQRVIDDGASLRISPPARAVSEPLIPRAIRGGRSQFILLGPGGGGKDPRRIALFRMSPVESESVYASDADRPTPESQPSAKPSPSRGAGTED